jgi:hypothetical protein
MEKNVKPDSYIGTSAILSNRACVVDIIGPRYTAIMSTDDKPKSAVELAMERLRRKDADSGVTERLTTDRQKALIAEARNLHASKLAELEILHRSKISGLFDPAERSQAEDGYRRDLTRLNEDLERKITKLRSESD